ncbi:MAG: amidohydrolase family protein, partial [Myxococcota bacterium]
METNTQHDDDPCAQHDGDGACFPAGDIDGDGVVNVRDVMALEAHDGQNVDPGDCADLNNDGVLDVLDVNLLANNIIETQPLPVPLSVACLEKELDAALVQGCGTAWSTKAQMASASEGCTLTQSDESQQGEDADLLIRGAAILGVAQVNYGEILIDLTSEEGSGKGLVACVGCDCTAGRTDVDIIECPNAIISPGMINTHDHLGFNHNPPPSPSLDELEIRYQHRNEWRSLCTAKPDDPVHDGSKCTVPYTEELSDEVQMWTELRQVAAGTTSIASNKGARGFLRNFGGNFLDSSDIDLTEGLDHSVRYNIFPLGDFEAYDYLYPPRGASGTCGFPTCIKRQAIEPCSDPFAGANAECGTCIDYPWMHDHFDGFAAHLGEGIINLATNESACVSNRTNAELAPETGYELSSADQAKADAHGWFGLGHGTAYIHMIGVHLDTAEELAATQTSVVWSPRSNLQLYGVTAPVVMYDHLDINIALGSDWTPSGSVNLQRELACARHYNDIHLSGHFSDRDLWRMVTFNAAQAINLVRPDDGVVLGVLEPHASADLTIIAPDTGGGDPYSAVVQSSAKNVDAVFRGGEFIYGLDRFANLGEDCQVFTTDTTSCAHGRVACGSSAVTETPLRDIAVMLDTPPIRMYAGSVVAFCDD